MMHVYNPSNVKESEKKNLTFMAKSNPTTCQKNKCLYAPQLHENTKYKNTLLLGILPHAY